MKAKDFGSAARAEAVRGNGDRFVDFRRERAERHRGGDEPRIDVFERLDFFEFERPVGLDDALAAGKSG